MVQEQPLEETDEYQNQSEAIEPEASDVDFNHVRGLMYALITICVFCASILLGPDEQILPSDGNLKIPILDLTIKQGSFLYFGPIIIICVSMYTYLFLLKILARVTAGREYSDQYIFTMRNPAAQIATYGIFFWLPTLVLFSFSYKGLPRPESANLLGVSLIFLIATVSIQLLLRGYSKFYSRYIFGISLFCVTLILYGFIEDGWLKGAREGLYTLRSVALEKVDLRDSDLRGVEIRNAEAESIKLTGANLSGAKIKDAALIGANLEGADLREARLECTKFNDANFDNADLRNAKLLISNFKGATFIGADLRGVIFHDGPENVTCSEPSIQKTSLVSANLEGADLREANLSQVSMRKTIFNGANLFNTKIIGAAANGSFFLKVTNSKTTEETNLLKADLRCSRFIDSKMEGAILERAELGGTDFTGANLANANLTNAKFDRTSCSDKCIDIYINKKIKKVDKIGCSGENIRNKHKDCECDPKGKGKRVTNLTKADLRGANLHGAKLSGVTLDETNLMLTYLSSTTGLTCEELKKAKFWKASIHDEKLACSQKVLNFEDFHEISEIEGEAEQEKALNNFRRGIEKFVQSYSKKPRKKLGGKDIFRILKGAKMSGLNLSRLKLDDIWLPEANLDRANLFSTQLNRANLKGAKLRGADLGRASLRAANLIGAETQITLKPIMKSTNLSYAKLEGARLNGANLRRANLRGANLSKATMKDTILDEADLEGATLIDVTYLTCPRLIVATNWKKSFRSLNLRCGSDNPSKNEANQ